eukprot:CAMPEP_0184697066 /NCGR_PEP_ID=MMETSP0313-20130426/4165_1 /TAXON_ID=2792 /ORGANISM="Porphyridium aerugineum, Strain SAG 1380-2" /LENGTH=211 /DNA_ID=CAMNT_0027155827 /DNA_START=1050 /DNA_END=1682 /DNA_ORIENTATION=-
MQQAFATSGSDKQNPTEWGAGAASTGQGNPSTGNGSNTSSSAAAQRAASRNSIGGFEDSDHLLGAIEGIMDDLAEEDSSSLRFTGGGGGGGGAVGGGGATTNTTGTPSSALSGSVPQAKGVASSGLGGGSNVSSAVGGASQGAAGAPRGYAAVAASGLSGIQSPQPRSSSPVVGNMDHRRAASPSSIQPLVIDVTNAEPGAHFLDQARQAN